MFSLDSTSGKKTPTKVPAWHSLICWLGVCSALSHHFLCVLVYFFTSHNVWKIQLLIHSFIISKLSFRGCEQMVKYSIFFLERSSFLKAAAPTKHLKISVIWDFMMFKKIYPAPAPVLFIHLFTRLLWQNHLLGIISIFVFDLSFQPGAFYVVPCFCVRSSCWGVSVRIEPLSEDSQTVNPPPPAHP